MDLNYFDLVVGGIVLLLGLKGILNGFFKEVFGLVGIVGGVFVASRFANQAGEYISNAVFHFTNESAINFTGFLVILAGFWAAMVVVGMIFKKLISASGLGIFDKILGFVFGAGKFFLIISIIVYAVYNMKSLREKLDETMHNSILFPIMVETGGFIMHFDGSEAIQTLQHKQQEIQESLENTIKQKASDIVESQVKDQVETIKEQTKKHTQVLEETLSDENKEEKTQPTLNVDQESE